MAIKSHIITIEQLMTDKAHEKEVLKSVNKKLKTELNLDKPSFPDRMADIVAEFGGSWTFIFIFHLFFAGWILFNIYVYPFDQPPFIGLNLALSFLAVVQVPFLLMSQNRISRIDRDRDLREYKLNIKLDIEIQELHDKLDLLLKKHID